ncbi:efflux RND transporter periplasmic adaptor subunit [Agrobacterium tumefaciens]|uniref:efflux RND transporter periplasmic adaptor subunit n=1 Tax=Agrobacterium tumefaciens TaxID=358 RepID=UPI002200BDDA|nr:efflux RND transporter periplasmic adaptor subunit [Agrobacterium tumefaciens]MEA1844782.1 efflux RND transporter periplasmic adaptor subunit [Agrobacterium tumefaciens]UXT84863.1 efflux RND transporter periplasmic adaptor subunit [Agrobacterium tumefaciens]
MSIGRIIFTSSSLVIVGAGTYAAGINGIGREQLKTLVAMRAISSPVQAKGSGKVIYFRHPDGLPEYSLSPKKTLDGRAFLEVRQSEDVSFEPVKPDVQQVGARRVLYYRNPMGLADTSPVPKKDSMGMGYLPVYDGDQPQAGELRVPLGKLQKTGVRTAIAERRKMSRRIRIPGTVQFDERRSRVVSMRTDAFIDNVASVTSGDEVKAGDHLFSFYSGDIARAAAEFSASVRAGMSGMATNGARQQLRNLGLQDQTIDEITKGGVVPRSLEYFAPMGGVVLERQAIPGMMAEAGATLFRLADNSVIWVIADVPEYDLAAIKVGQPVTVRFSNAPGEQTQSSIALIYPDLQTQTRTAKIRIEVPNPTGTLRANMFAEVEVETGGEAPVLSVPASAVIDTGDRQIVFIDKGEGRFETRDVKLGVRGNDEVEIVRGIDPGARVVATANFLLDAESNLTSALNALVKTESKP